MIHAIKDINYKFKQIELKYELQFVLLNFMFAFICLHLLCAMAYTSSINTTIGYGVFLSITFLVNALAVFVKLTKYMSKRS